MQPRRWTPWSMRYCAGRLAADGGAYQGRRVGLLARFRGQEKPAELAVRQERAEPGRAGALIAGGVGAGIEGQDAGGGIVGIGPAPAAGGGVGRSVDQAEGHGRDHPLLVQALIDAGDLGWAEGGRGGGATGGGDGVARGGGGRRWGVGRRARGRRGRAGGRSRRIATAEPGQDRLALGRAVHVGAGEIVGGVAPLVVGQTGVGAVIQQPFDHGRILEGPDRRDEDGVLVHGRVAVVDVRPFGQGRQGGALIEVEAAGRGDIEAPVGGGHLLGLGGRGADRYRGQGQGEGDGAEQAGER